ALARRLMARYRSPPFGSVLGLKSVVPRVRTGASGGRSGCDESLYGLETGGTILSFNDFNAVYCALTGHDGACRWQHRLFTEFEAGTFPTDIELATGLGKTSIIVLWVLALGRALARGSYSVPRRLAYVVDRRVVVDQASEFAEQVRERLEQAAKDEN